MVAAIYEQRDGDVVRLMMQGMLIVAALCLLYGGAILVGWPLIEAYIFADKYPDMTLIVALWWIYTSVMSLNYVASAVLQARRQFRDLGILGGLGALFAVLGLIAIGQTAAAVEMALYVLIAIETVEFAGQLYLVGRGHIYRGVEVPA
jgi:O-antigen/teichoic acid export membrane protein